jgi:hypothetical protein
MCLFTGRLRGQLVRIKFSRSASFTPTRDASHRPLESEGDGLIPCKSRTRPRQGRSGT